MAHQYVSPNRTFGDESSFSSDMEDAHVHILSLPEDKNCAFFAVYDGHGGATGTTLDLGLCSPFILI
jgi:serine/threonine protein phosphatase PrpC